MVPLLVVVAILAGGAGVMSLSQATLGVGLVAAGCLLAICARITQAHEQHKLFSDAVDAEKAAAANRRTLANDHAAAG